MRIPALIVLLPVGFAAGALTSDVNPDKLLGPAFQPLVSLAVAVILYDAGLGHGHPGFCPRHLILPTVALVAVLVLIARPLVALTATLRTDLSSGERGLVGWMAPRLRAI